MTDSIEDQKPLKIFLIELLAITSFLSFLSILTLVYSFPMVVNVVTAFFTGTNISTSQSFFITQTWKSDFSQYKCEYQQCN